MLLTIFKLSKIYSIITVYHDAEALSFIILKEAIERVAIDVDNSAETLADTFEEWTLVEHTMELHLCEAIVWHRLCLGGELLSPTDEVANDSSLFDEFYLFWSLLWNLIAFIEIGQSLLFRRNGLMFLILICWYGLILIWLFLLKCFRFFEMQIWLMQQKVLSQNNSQLLGSCFIKMKQ